MPSKSIDALARQAQSILGIELAEAQLAQFEQLTDLLLDWNARMNLTGITEPAEIALKHYLDSLTVLNVLPKARRGRLLDVGTGAGFPGLPLAIARPWLRVTLLDATAKKLRFVEAAGRALGLDNIRIAHARAEDAGRDDAHRGTYDFVTARAVSRMPALMECTLPLTKRGGMVIAMKGAATHAEVRSANKAIATLGGELADIHEVRLPGLEKPRFLALVRKVGKTPRRYPRQAGSPSRDPIL
ncbi:MAG: 16S rRNA (guanine(527)-N(7))-methyltransferase RsmG [Chloroflexi bacterium]|nr:16S rRNA (guanine(527)-N(7))-methyltransferase RsmG [Chloroflexota bacterium]MCY4248583.1 16S rRNA (guanine(527)-N(7))-methyltransferase RsmG [Chloroflexota bacterium]